MSVASPLALCEPVPLRPLPAHVGKGPRPFELELAARIRAGDREAAHELVQTQERLIRWWVRRYAPKMQTFSADDLCQEGYLALFRAALEYDPISRPFRFTTLACTSLHRHFLTVLRQDRRWLTGGPANHPMRLPYYDDAFGEEAEIWDEKSELREHFWILAAKLSDRERIILRLRIDGETLRSIASAFELSAERVRQIEKRAITRMKKEWSRSA